MIKKKKINNIAGSRNFPIHFVILGSAVVTYSLSLKEHENTQNNNISL